MSFWSIFMFLQFFVFFGNFRRIGLIVKVVHYDWAFGLVSPVHVMFR